jgi:hypothetical protein
MRSMMAGTAILVIVSWVITGLLHHSAAWIRQPPLYVVIGYPFLFAASLTFVVAVGQSRNERRPRAAEPVTGRLRASEAMKGPAGTRSKEGLTRFLLICQFFAWALLIVLFGFVVPAVEAIFADLAIPLPHVTRLVIRMSYESVTIASLILVVLAADWLILNSRSDRRGTELVPVSAGLMLAFPVLLSALTLVALVLPLFLMDYGLSG